MTANFHLLMWWNLRTNIHFSTLFSSNMLYVLYSSLISFIPNMRIFMFTLRISKLYCHRIPTQLRFSFMFIWILRVLCFSEENNFYLSKMGRIFNSLPATLIPVNICTRIALVSNCRVKPSKGSSHLDALLLELHFSFILQCTQWPLKLRACFSACIYLDFRIIFHIPMQFTMHLVVRSRSYIIFSELNNSFFLDS